MLRPLFFIAALAAACAAVQAQVPVINGALTVNDFAMQCQHPRMKSNPDARIDACFGWVRSSIESVGQANRTPECWEDLEHVIPLVTSDLLFHMATLPDERRRPLTPATREAILVGAKRCR